MNKNKRTNWVFDCPDHGYEEGLLCSKAYDYKLSKRWFKVEYTLVKIRTTAEEKKEWTRVMNLTRQYNGVLPA